MGVLSNFVSAEQQQQQQQQEKQTNKKKNDSPCPTSAMLFKQNNRGRQIKLLKDMRYGEDTAQILGPRYQNSRLFKLLFSNFYKFNAFKTF